MSNSFNSHTITRLTSSGESFVATNRVWSLVSVPSSMYQTARPNAPKRDNTLSVIHSLRNLCSTQSFLAKQRCQSAKYLLYVVMYRSELSQYSGKFTFLGEKFLKTSAFHRA